MSQTTMSMGNEILYPTSDGKPMADNTKQLQWIVMLYDNLSALFADRADVFVGADLLWYPIEGSPDIRIAPDVLLAFGRPKGHRGSYLQWEEADIPLTVVWEILSPGNTHVEMVNKQLFYEDHGVEEYYVYDPDTNFLVGYLRQGTVFRRIRSIEGFVSPRMTVRFDLSGPELVVRYPDGAPFVNFQELAARTREAEQRAGDAEQRAGDAEQRAGDAEQRAGDAEERAGEAEQRANWYRDRVTRLRELGRKARAGQASEAELQELDQLEQEEPPA